MDRIPIVPIVGGGPAGMSCALWLHNFGLAPLIIESEPLLGGMQRRSPYPNIWLLGRPGALARENADDFVRHITQEGIRTLLGASPDRLIQHGEARFELGVAFVDGRPPETLSCSALVIATGTQFRSREWLDSVTNARALVEKRRVHIGPACAGEASADFGSHALIVGGGDNAFDVARLLRAKGTRVTIAMRSQRPRAQAMLVERATADIPGSGGITIETGQRVLALAEDGSRIQVRLGDSRALVVDHVILTLGYEPNTRAPWIDGLRLAKDPDGYLTVDGNAETSCRNVFAVGDVANPAHPCTATAIAMGTMAAREIQRRAEGWRAND